VARTKQPPISTEDRSIVGALLRDLRKAAGYRSVDAAAAEDAAPSSRQTIYAYERGGLTPSLTQFLDLAEGWSACNSTRFVPATTTSWAGALTVTTLASKIE